MSSPPSTPNPPSPPTQSTSNQIKSTQLLLNHHPSINFNTNATPIPSFPRMASIQSLKSHQRQSEAFFLNHIASGASPGLFSPSKQQQQQPIINSTSDFFAAPKDSPGPTTLRLIETSTRDSSYPSLPYPDPDISLNMTAPKTPFVLPLSTQSNRRISALPTRATPASGSAHLIFTKPPIENVEQLSCPETHDYIKSSIPESTSLVPQLPPSSTKSTMTESMDKENQPIPRPIEAEQSRPEQPSLQKPKPSQSSLQKHYASPAAAISATVLQPLVIEPASVEENGTSTMDQMWAEMQTRAKAAPGIGKALLPDSILLNPIEAKPLDDNQDRFQETHLKTFSKFDSITNHYAAKRKVTTTDVPAVASTSQKPTTTIPETNKRQKTNALGYAKRLENEKEEKEALKRRLELAKARRKSQAANVAGTKGKLPPSGFSSFGNRLKSATKSVYEKVTGALTNTINTSSPLKTKVQESSKSSRQTGVGFGVPSGLGIGPANPPKKVIPQRSVSVNNKNRLPPAGPTSVGNTLRSRQQLRSVSNSATIGSKRIVSGASTATEPGTLHRRGNIGSLSTRPLRTRTISATTKGTEPSATNKQLTTVKPLITKPAAAGTRAGIKAPITKLVPTLPNAPPKLSSPIKRINPSTAQQVTRTVIKPTKPQLWKPHTVKTITPRPIRSRPLTTTTKPSAIPQPKYKSSTRAGPSNLRNPMVVGKTVIRSSVTLPVPCKSKRLLRNPNLVKQEEKKVVVGGKRGLDEDEEVVEKPPSQKKMKVT